MSTHIWGELTHLLSEMSPPSRDVHRHALWTCPEIGHPTDSQDSHVDSGASGQCLWGLSRRWMEHLDTGRHPLWRATRVHIIGFALHSFSYPVSSVASWGQQIHTKKDSFRTEMNKNSTTSWKPLVIRSLGPALRPMGKPTESPAMEHCDMYSIKNTKLVQTQQTKHVAEENKS